MNKDEANRNFELTIRRYVVQKDLNSHLLNIFLEYIDEVEDAE